VCVCVCVCVSPDSSVRGLEVELCLPDVAKEGVKRLQQHQPNSEISVRIPINNINSEISGRHPPFSPTQPRNPATTDFWHALAIQPPVTLSRERYDQHLKSFGSEISGAHVEEGGGVL